MGEMLEKKGDIGNGNKHNRKLTQASLFAETPPIDRGVDSPKMTFLFASYARSARQRNPQYELPITL